MLKVGFYFGSFNPIHKGHIRVIENAIKEKNLDRVVIVPTMHNPAKKKAPIDIDERIFLIRAALLLSGIKINGKHIYKYCDVDDIEKKMIPPYYTYATLEALKNKYYGNETYIICGHDTMDNISNWMNGGYIVGNNKFIVCERTKESSTEVRQCVKDFNLNRLNELVPTWLIKRVINDYRDA